MTTDKKIFEIPENALVNGLLNLKSIEKITDYPTFEYLITNYPIHYCELIHNLCKDQKYPELFKYSIDKGWEEIARCIVVQNFDGIESWAYKHFVYYKSYGTVATLKDNESYLYGIKQCSNSTSYIEEIQKIKTELLNPLKEKWNARQTYINTLKQLPKELFDNLYANGDNETLIIKLCIRLEAFLNSKGYNGELIDNIENYCKDNKIDETTKTLLHNLRKQRNELVHASINKSVALQSDEIKYCIYIICSLED